MASTTPAVARSHMLPAQITTMIAGLMPDVRTLLPGDISYEQFRAALWLELTGNPSIKQCTVDSIRAGAIKCATYGMLPGRDAHLLPFRNKGRYEATFVPNYFGVLLTLERSGKVARAFAHPVYDGDEFILDYFADEYHHVPYSVRKHAPGALRFFYGAVKMRDGTTHIEVMTEEEIDAVRRRAPAHDSGPWQSDYLMMARKTALKRVCKYVRLTPQQEHMLEDDEAREQTDIPPERHRQNITDLFGEEAAREIIDVTPTTGSLWLDTLAQHWQHVPEPLRGQCRAVVEGTHPVSDSEGLALAEQVLDALERQEDAGV